MKNGTRKRCNGRNRLNAEKEKKKTLGRKLIGTICCYCCAHVTAITLQLHPYQRWLQELVQSCVHWIYFVTNLNRCIVHSEEENNGNAWHMLIQFVLKWRFFPVLRGPVGSRIDFFCKCETNERIGTIDRYVSAIVSTLPFLLPHFVRCFSCVADIFGIYHRILPVAHRLILIQWLWPITQLRAWACQTIRRERRRGQRALYKLIRIGRLGNVSQTNRFVRSEGLSESIKIFSISCSIFFVVAFAVWFWHGRESQRYTQRVDVMATATTEKHKQKCGDCNRKPIADETTHCIFSVTILVSVSRFESRIHFEHIYDAVPVADWDSAATHNLCEMQQQEQCIDSSIGRWVGRTHCINEKNDSTKRDRNRKNEKMQANSLTWDSNSYFNEVVNLDDIDENWATAERTHKRQQQQQRTNEEEEWKSIWNWRLAALDGTAPSVNLVQTPKSETNGVREREVEGRREKKNPSIRWHIPYNNLFIALTDALLLLHYRPALIVKRERIALPPSHSLGASCPREATVNIGQLPNLIFFCLFLFSWNDLLLAFFNSTKFICWCKPLLELSGSLLVDLPLGTLRVDQMGIDVKRQRNAIDSIIFPSVISDGNKNVDVST